MQDATTPTPQPRPIVIALCGPIGVGKSTFARALLETATPGEGVRASFADPLRDMLAALGVPPEAMRSRKEEPCPELGGRTPRHALQTLGTEWGRGYMGADFWADSWARRVVEVTSPAPSTGRVMRGEWWDRIAPTGARLVVADDLRFPNEAKVVRRLGGHVVLLRREGIEPVSDGGGWFPTHASEATRWVAPGESTTEEGTRVDFAVQLPTLLRGSEDRKDTPDSSGSWHDLVRLARRLVLECTWRSAAQRGERGVVGAVERKIGKGP